jgi:His-Xaa-Ser system protein HxsD
MYSHHNHISGSEIFAFADANLYSSEAIFKCLYWYGDKFGTDVRLADQVYQIKLVAQPDSGVTEPDMAFYLRKLERDLVDFNLRDIVTRETATIRELLIAKAFSNGEDDEVPPGSISDPVGFDIHGL